MTDRAFSLFRTVIHPVLSTLRRNSGGERLPVAPHHGVPAVHLSGVILSRESIADPAIAEAMYGGIYEFDGIRVEALPDAVFAAGLSQPKWRSALLRMDWLASFRASGRPLHGLFALRLISSWVAANPLSPHRSDQIAALFNLAVDAPAIAASQSPAAVAMATTAILRAQHPVGRLKPASATEALARSMALLAAHLTTRRNEVQRDKLVSELTAALSAVLHDDGSLRQGSVDELCALQRDLAALLDGLDRSGDRTPADLAGLALKMKAYLSLLVRGDGTLAFTNDAGLSAPTGLPVQRGSCLAAQAGHARLAAGQTLLLASIATLDRAQPLRMEMNDAGRALLWLEQSGSGRTVSGEANALICASGGTLLELRDAPSAAARQHLAVFLSADGSDIRVEDMSDEKGTRTYLLHVPEQARLSTTHAGTGAMIVPPAGQAWQLLVRGGRIEVDHGYFRILADADGRHPLNFALKRVPKAERQARPAKSRDRGGPRLL